MHGYITLAVPGYSIAWLQRSFLQHCLATALPGQGTAWPQHCLAAALPCYNTVYSLAWLQHKLATAILPSYSTAGLQCCLSTALPGYSTAWLQHA